jgi:hypothetical protein
MLNWIKHLDRLLRGEITSLPALRNRGLEVPILGIAVMIDLLGVAYGLCMGLFAVTGSGSGAAMQIPASMIKVPALFLLTLQRMAIASEMAGVGVIAEPQVATPDVPPDQSQSAPMKESASPEFKGHSPLERLGGQLISGKVKSVFRIWLVVFALVGAQMGWVLRPFIGAPGQAFTWLRPKQSNFFIAVASDLAHLVGGDSTGR